MSTTAKSKQTKKVTQQELRDILLKTKGHQFVTITSMTSPKMNKNIKLEDGSKVTNPLYGRVQKLNTFSASINGIYENAVNNRHEKSGSSYTFHASPRKWGNRLEGTPLVENKGSYYIETIFNPAQKSTPVYKLDGQTVEKSEVEDYFVPKSNSSWKKQGLGKKTEVVLRDFKLSSIKELIMGGNHYIVVG